MSATKNPAQAAESGSASKTVTGIVTSDKMQKTRAVKVSRLERHAKYGKYLRRHTTYYAHDEKEVSRIGDTVRIVETRPLSKLKRWRLLEIVAKSRYAGTAPVTETLPEAALPQAGKPKDGGVSP